MEVLQVLIAALTILGANGLTHRGKYNLTESFVVNSSSPYVLSYYDTGTEGIAPFKVQVVSMDSTLDYPILAVVSQERRVTSWQIPLLEQSAVGVAEYRNTCRILCYDTTKVIAEYANLHPTSRFNPLGHRNHKKDFTIAISTFSPINVEVQVFARIFSEYFLDTGVPYEVSFSPSQPVYYSYSFPNRTIADEKIETVLIVIQSDDETCFTVSVQPKVCPVRDLNHDITFEGKYQTISTKGGITVTKSQFPDGFILVFVSKNDNSDCSQPNSLLPQPRIATITANKQISHVRFQILAGKTKQEYLIALMTIFWANFAICLLFFILTVIFYHCGRYKAVEEFPEPRTAILELPIDEIDAYFDKNGLTVADFVRQGRRNNRKALNYFWHITNIAIFYGLPVVQLMISYQRTVDTSGNLDICYHNFHCSQPYYFTDFSHIYSNIGYVFFGTLFLAITFYKNQRVRNQPGCGVPKFHGLYYAMGMALIFEGVLSACYHICPNQSNFQFDTSFMYVMAVLIMVKLYQNRHPDINASAYATFFVLGLAVCVAMFGILFNSTIIMLLFILSYIALCVFLAFQIYFFGHVLRGFSYIYKTYQVETFTTVIKPMRTGRFVTLIIANICNFVIAITGMALYPRHVDFGTFLLGILLINSVMHAIFYMVMKLVHKERICCEAILYGVLGLIAWGFGTYFFLDASTRWSVTPAESRQLNKECLLMNFYDTHDVWHLISAPALFFTFMFLLALDDDLFDKKQDEISAF